jgi:hypothetical protein
MNRLAVVLLLGLTCVPGLSNAAVVPPTAGGRSRSIQPRAAIYRSNQVASVQVAPR